MSGKCDQLPVPKKNVIIALNFGRSYACNVKKSNFTRPTIQERLLTENNSRARMNPPGTH